MGKYRLFIKPSALKEIEALPTKKDRRRIIAKIRELAGDPRPPGAVKLSGPSKYRLRQSRYRILYTVDDDRVTVTVVKVGHRKDVYRP